MTLYVRNWRPGLLTFKYADNKYTLEGRGHREDNIALPDEAIHEPVIRRFFRDKRLERISEEAYMNLGSRPEDEKMPPLVKASGLRHGKSRPLSVGTGANDHDVSPELEANKVRSPGLEFEYAPEPTLPLFEEEVQAGDISPRGKVVPLRSKK